MNEMDILKKISMYLDEGYLDDRAKFIMIEAATEIVNLRNQHSRRKTDNKAQEEWDFK